MKKQSTNRYIGLSLKLLILIFNVSVGTNLNAQILLSPRITSTGSVIPLIQPKTAFDIYHNAAITYSDYAVCHCGDSLFLHSAYEGDLRYCMYEYDFTSSWLNDRRFEGWVNNPDPFSVQELDAVGYNDRWRRIDQVTWRYSYSTGISNEYSNRQTWKFDEKKRLHKITRWYGDFDHEPEMELEYFYNSLGSLVRVSTKHYGSGHKVSDISQQVWFYDKKQRTRMMLSYNAPYRQFSPQDLEVFAKKLEAGVRKGEQEKIISIDSLDLKSLLVYNNGPYGPEQVNYYAESAPSYDIPVYVSDSLYYDEKGRVLRYVSGRFGFHYRMGWVELIYNYEPHSTRLKQVDFHRYSERQNQERTENKSIQWFIYDSHGRINSSTEQQFYLKSDYLDGKYTEPEEQLLGEDKCHFKYKP